MKKFNELKLISYIEGKIQGSYSDDLLLGIGDDAALIKGSKRDNLSVISTDSFNEQIHFRFDYADPYSVGIKLARVNISDISAMGAIPKYIFLSINYNDSTDFKVLKKIIDGFLNAIQADNIDLAGGNISKIDSKLSFNVTIVGEQLKDKVISRSNAKLGDSIYITGTPGESSLGLYFLEQERLMANRSSIKRRLIDKHLRPPSRVQWGLAIAKHAIASSMIDISDGIILDLERLLNYNDRLSASIDLSDFPLSDSLKKVKRGIGDLFWERVLTGGEDYELLFTVSKKVEPRLRELINKKTIVASKLGDVVKLRPYKDKIQISSGSVRALKLQNKGWIH
ncbi:MAG: thiamine-phosphate kinase [Nitrospinota bacterium]